jgi:competence protein ComEA
MRTLVSLFALCTLCAGYPLAQSAEPRQPPAKPAAVVNLNTASLAELQELPGIGEKTAARIVEYRQKRGPFKKIEELMNVQGVGEKSFLKIRAQITVGAAKPEAAAPQFH